MALGSPALIQCSATCGEGIQQRQVVCRNSSNALGPCEGVKPDTVQVCSLPACRGERKRWGGPAPSFLWPRDRDLVAGVVPGPLKFLKQVGHP